MSYLNIHQALNDGRYAWGANDPLYRSLNLLIPNFYIFVAITSFFYLVCIFFLIKNNLTRNQYWFASLILLINPYLFLIHLSAFRQTLSICFVILAVYYGIKKRAIFYFFLVLIASGFHQSALIMLPIYFLLTNKKLNVVKITTIVFLVFILLSTPLLGTLINWTLDFFPSHYSSYYEEGLQNSLRSTLISSFFFFLILFNINKLEGQDLIYGKLSLIATIISLLAYKVSMISRIGMYFDVFLIVTIPVIFSKIKNVRLRTLLFVLMIFIYLLRYWSFFNNDIWIDSYGTYQTILGR